MTQTSTNPLPMANPPRNHPPAAQPFNVTKFRPGLDYQVAHEKLINGRKYKAGEILDQQGLTNRQIEIWRDQRILLDIPLGGSPVIPVPKKAADAPLSKDDKLAMTVKPDAPEGRVKPKHRGFGKWFCVDESDNNVGPAFEGDAGAPARTRCLRRCIEINDAAGHEVSDEDRSNAGHDLEKD